MSIQAAPIPAQAPRASGAAPARATGPEPRHFHWPGDLYDRLVALGQFSGERVELIDGEILQMSPMNEPHARTIQIAMYALLRVFPPPEATIRIQLPMRLGADSRPEPDLAVVSGDSRQVAGHVTGALLVVEISDATLDFDRTKKAALYAEHGIVDYWIVNLADRCVEIYRQPIHDPVSGHRYGEVRVLRPGDNVAPLAAPQAVIAVNDLLP